MNATRSGVVSVLLLFSMIVTGAVAGTTAPREDPLPAWGDGSYWTYATDSEIAYNVSEGGNTLNLTHISGVNTDRIIERTVFGGVPVVKLEGSYSLTIKGNMTYMSITMPLNWPVTGNTAEYYRTTDLATVYAEEHFTINMGALGTTVMDSNQTPVPPLATYGFPLSVPDDWHVDTNVTIWQKTTSPLGNSESTNVTRDVYDAAIAKQESMTVQAGAFNCYNISESGYSSTDGGAPVLFNNTRLYSPKATNLVLKGYALMANMTVMFQLSDYLLNTPPAVADPLPVVSFPEDTVYTALDLDDVFTESDTGDALTFFAYNFTKVMVIIDNGTGQVTMTPTKDWCGTDRVLFKAMDKRGAYASVAMNITVTPVNDAPVLNGAIPDAKMDENAQDSSLDLSKYFSDPDLQYGDSLAYSFRDNGTVAVKIALNGTVTLTPQGDWSGRQNVTFVAKDNSSKDASDTIEVTVTPLPDSPFVTATTHSLSVDEDTPLNTSLAQRFSDPDLPYGDSLAYSMGGFTQGWTASVDPATGALSALPPKDFNGLIDVTFTATDKTQRAASESVSISVRPVNDPPEITGAGPSGASASVPENSSRLFNVTASDIDTATLTIMWSLDGNVVATGPNLTYSPDFNAAGAHNITATVSDGHYNVSRSWAVTVTNVNRAPVEVRIIAPLNGSKSQEGKAVLLQASATDPDGDSLTYRWKDTGGKLLEGGASVSTKLLTKGKHVLTLEVSDGNDTTSATVTVSVSAKPKTNTPGFEAPAFMVAVAFAFALVLLAKRRK